VPNVEPENFIYPYLRNPHSPSKTPDADYRWKKPPFQAAATAAYRKTSQDRKSLRENLAAPINLPSANLREKTADRWRLRGFDCLCIFPEFEKRKDRFKQWKLDRTSFDTKQPKPRDRKQEKSSFRPGLAFEKLKFPHIRQLYYSNPLLPG